MLNGLTNVRYTFFPALESELPNWSNLENAGMRVRRPQKGEGRRHRARAMAMSAFGFRVRT